MEQNSTHPITSGELERIIDCIKSLQARCDRYEKALKLAGLDSLIEALSAGEAEKAGLEWLYNDHIEFCYRHPDGRIEVKYRRIEGTHECNSMIAEVGKLIERAKPEVSPYFYRKENQKEDQ